MTSVNVKILTDENFDQEAMQASVPVLVDIWGEGCQPCMAMAPTIDELADEYQGKVVVGKLNVGENLGTGNKFRITGVPTLLMFKNGQLVRRLVGLRTKRDLKAELEALLK
jgi:thioredoxin 1